MVLLYLSALRPGLDEAAARGEYVTEHMRLGDHFTNAANATTRHNAGLRATYTAIISAISAAVGPAGRVAHGSILEAILDGSILEDWLVGPVVRCVKCVRTQYCCNTSSEESSPERRTEAFCGICRTLTIAGHRSTRDQG